MDSLGSLALATEPPRIELLNRPPQGRNDYIISRKMAKHILGVFCFQICVVYAIVFGGENFFPEPEVKYRFDRPDVPFVYPGRLQNWDGSPLYDKYVDEHGISRHMSCVFNVFVYMQVFNFVNARKVNDEVNIFQGV